MLTDNIMYLSFIIYLHLLLGLVSLEMLNVSEFLIDLPSHSNVPKTTKYVFLKEEL